MSAYPRNLEEIAVEFRPDDLKFLRTWEVDLDGVPVPLETGNPAVLWKGKFDDSGRAPVLLAACEQGQRISSECDWFAGIARIDKVTAGSASELAYLEKAADIYVSTLLDALTILKVELRPVSNSDLN